MCRKAFCEVHGLGHHTLRSLQEHVEAGLIVPPPHKLTGRPAKHAVSESVKHDITMFIRNYASSFGMPQPAAPRGTSGVAPIYLPASLSILELHRLYCVTPILRGEWAVTHSGECGSMLQRTSLS